MNTRKIMTQQMLEKARERFEELQAFFPSDLCEKFVNEALDKELKELETAIKKQALRDMMAGKKPSDFPLPTDAERNEEITRVVTTIRLQITGNWHRFLNLVSRKVTQPIKLDDNLLPPVALRDVGFEDSVALIANHSGIAKDQIVQLHEEFAKNVKDMVAKNPIGYSINGDDELILRKQADGFYLYPQTEPINFV